MPKGVWVRVPPSALFITVLLVLSPLNFLYFIMKVELKKESNQLDALLDIEVTSSDFLPEMETELKEQRKNIKVPGFRPGKVPLGLVKKMAGESLKQEIVLRIAVNRLYDYLKENTLEVINKPIIENKEEAFKGAKEQETVNLTFRLGLKPDFNPDITVLNGLTQFEAEITEEDVNNEIEQIRKQYAEFNELTEVIDDNDLIFNMLISELDEKGKRLEGGISKSKHLRLDKAQSGLKKLIMGKKPKETFKIDVEEFLNSVEEKAKFFEIDENAAKDIGSKFECELFFIYKEIPAKLDNALFEKVFGHDEVKDTDAFKSKIKETLESHYKSMSNNILAREITTALSEKINISLPEVFISKWHEEYSEEVKDKESVINAEDFKKEVSKRIIYEKLMETNGIDTNEDEIKENTQMRLYHEFQRSGQAYDETKFNKSLESLLSNSEFIEKTKEDIKLNKMYQTLIEKGKFKKEKLGTKEFLEKYKKEEN